MSYPKWVSRGYGLGEILCLNAEEEAQVKCETKPAPEPVVEEPARKKPGPKPKVKD